MSQRERERKRAIWGIEMPNESERITEWEERERDMRERNAKWERERMTELEKLEERERVKTEGDRKWVREKER